MATFEVQSGDRANLAGDLRFDTVGSLLNVGNRVIGEGRVAVIDLAGVSSGDSAGLALLASDRQCYPCQLGVPKSVSFVVTDHAADKEVQQESFFGIGGP